MAKQQTKWCLICYSAWLIFGLLINDRPAFVRFLKRKRESSSNPRMRLCASVALSDFVSRSFNASSLSASIDDLEKENEIGALPAPLIIAVYEASCWLRLSDRANACRDDLRTAHLSPIQQRRVEILDLCRSFYLEKQPDSRILNVDDAEISHMRFPHVMRFAQGRLLEASNQRLLAHEKYGTALHTMPLSDPNRLLVTTHFQSTAD